MTYANPHFLVETEWLEAHLGDPGLRVIDCRIDMVPAEGGGLRFVPAADAWKEDHIPGATFVDFNQDLSDRDHKLQFMLPPPSSLPKSCPATALVTAPASFCTTVS